MLLFHLIHLNNSSHSRPNASQRVYQKKRWGSKSRRPRREKVGLLAFTESSVALAFCIRTPGGLSVDGVDDAAVAGSGDTAEGGVNGAAETGDSEEGTSGTEETAEGGELSRKYS